MSYYATADEFLSTLSQDIIDDLGTDPDDRDVLTLAIDQAEQYIHGFICGKTLPVTGPLSVLILKHHTLTIARAYLLERRLAGRYAESSMEFFRVSKDWLERLGDGKVSLPDADDAATPEITDDTAIIDSDEPVFNKSGAAGSL